jgi:alpha-acetolactate decarboxylase
VKVKKSISKNLKLQKIFIQKIISNKLKKKISNKYKLLMKVTDLNNISINIRIENKFWKIKMKTIKKKKMKIKQ